MWNEKLGRLIGTYPDGVLSIVDGNGYPFSIRCQVRADAVRHHILIIDPPALAQCWRGPANLLFHEHDRRLERLRQLMVVGQLVDEGGVLTLVVEKFLTANGRNDSDQMPHASSPIHMFKFFLIGWRNARRYLAKRGKPWPPTPYNEIARLIADGEKKETTENPSN
jgi:hypothetical protein